VTATDGDLRHRLEIYYFNTSTIDTIVAHIEALEPRWREFVTHWVLSVARTEPEIGFQFACLAGAALRDIGREGCERWLQAALDVYFEQDLDAAVGALHDLEKFIASEHKRARAMELVSVRRLLQHFLYGLDGRHLRIETGEEAFTDSEVVYLPPVIDHFPAPQQNFDCYRALAVHLWAQCWYGTWRADSIESIPREEPMLRTFHYLETLRLNACIARDYPGLARQMQQLQPPTPENWLPLEKALADTARSVRDSIRLSADHWDMPRPAPYVYQGKLDPDRVQATLEARLEREKRQLQQSLAHLADEQREAGKTPPAESATPGEAPEPVIARDSGAGIEFQLGGRALPADEDVDELMISIMQDLGDLPSEYLSAADDIDYRADFDARESADKAPATGRADRDGTPRFLYDEWDCTRQAHRKRWCTVRERDIQPDHGSTFVAETLDKYHGHIKSLRRGFEVLRDEYRILKKQPDGDSLDFDALVEAIADARSGMEMSSRIYRKAHRVERDIAVVLMVDMSGSTKGWINRAQREALILLAEALSSLDDRYAIYGFSGNTRKRCEIFRIKTFDEVYDDEIRARIAAVEPQDYTRMGATIRHLTSLLAGVDARTRLLITLSDGKPDDYDAYHGEYGIEDTRMALFEARQRGIHPFCITIDEQARDYLPHMYGDSSYVLIDDVARLPYRISEIYRNLTT
jgi:nitric oxide reductase NorD protein